MRWFGYLKFFKGKRFQSDGFTLIEVMAVIVILGILAGIAVPSVIGAMEKAKQEVCNVNVLELERMYKTYLALECIEHSDLVFNQYLQGYENDVCPDDGEISYVEGEVKCSIHSIDDAGSNENEGDEGVPFL